MNKNSIWQQNIFANTRTKTIFLIILGVILIGLATLAWANQTGKISLWASGGITINTNCLSDGTQKDFIQWPAPTSSGFIVNPTSYTYSVKYYNGGWQQVPNCYHKVTRACEYDHFPAQYNYKVIYHINDASAGNELGQQRAPKTCGGTQPTTPTTTTPTDPNCDQCKDGDYGCIGDDAWNCVNQNGCRVKISEGCHPPQTTCTIVNEGGLRATCRNPEAPTPTPTYTTPSPPTPTTPAPSYSTGSIEMESVSADCKDNGKQDVHLTWKVNQTPSAPGIINFQVQVKQGTGWANAIGGNADQVGSGIIEYMHHNNEREATITDYPQANPSTWRILMYSTGDYGKRADTGESTLEKCNGNVSPSPSPTSTAHVVPDAPANFSAQALSNSQIKLSWDRLGNDVVRYNLYNADNPTTPIEEIINSGTSEKVEFIIKGLKCNTKYSYFVTAVNDAGDESEPSQPASATTGACGTPSPDIVNQTPSNFQVHPTGEYSVVLNWDKLDGATGYDIYDCNNNYIVSTDQLQYEFESLNCGTEYCYYIKAHDDAGNESKPSNQAKATTDNCPSEAPSAPSVASLVSTGASLWFNILLALIITACVGYFLFRSRIWGNRE